MGEGHGAFSQHYVQNCLESFFVVLLLQLEGKLVPEIRAESRVMGKLWGMLPQRRV